MQKKCRGKSKFFLLPESVGRNKNSYEYSNVTTGSKKSPKGSCRKVFTLGVQNSIKTVQKCDKFFTITK
jgi:hypothetical protein